MASSDASASWPSLSAVRRQKRQAACKALQDELARRLDHIECMVGQVLGGLALLLPTTTSLEKTANPDPPPGLTLGHQAERYDIGEIHVDAMVQTDVWEPCTNLNAVAECSCDVSNGACQMDTPLEESSKNQVSQQHAEREDCSLCRETSADQTHSAQLTSTPDTMSLSEYLDATIGDWEELQERTLGLQFTNSSACSKDHELHAETKHPLQNCLRVQDHVRALQNVRTIDEPITLLTGELYKFLGFEDEAARMEYSYENIKRVFKVRRQDLSKFESIT